MYDAQLILTGLLTSSVSILLALGFQLTYSTTKIFHFAYAGLYNICGYTAYYAIEERGLSIVLGVVLAAVAAVAATAFIELAIYRALRRRGASELAILIASLGCLTVIQSAVAIIWGNQSLTIHTPAWLSGGTAIAGLHFQRIVLVEFALDVVIFAGLLVLAKRTRTGRELRGVADDHDRARMLGINVNYLYLVAFIVGTLILVPTAVLEGMHVGLLPYTITDLLLIASVAAFAGGIGSLTGTFIAACVAGLAGGFATIFVSQVWTTALIFALLTVLVLVKPSGLAGQAVRQGRT